MCQGMWIAEGATSPISRRPPLFLPCLWNKMHPFPPLPTICHCPMMDLWTQPRVGILLLSPVCCTGLVLLATIVRWLPKFAELFFIYALIYFILKALSLGYIRGYTDNIKSNTIWWWRSSPAFDTLAIVHWEKFATKYNSDTHWNWQCTNNNRQRCIKKWNLAIYLWFFWRAPRPIGQTQIKRRMGSRVQAG